MPKIRPKINQCVCGCGELVAGKFKRGHNMFTDEGRQEHSQAMKEKGICGEKHHSWKGGSNFSKVEITHRAVMEQFLGRKLESWELVHHIDENPENNTIENLELLNRALHMTCHRTGKCHTSESIKLMSQNRKGKTAGEKNPMYGKQHSFETRRKMSESQKQRFQYKEDRQCV